MPSESPAIRVRDLGKRYRLARHRHHDAPKGTVPRRAWNALTTPWRLFQEIRSLTDFSEEHDAPGDDVFWALKGLDFEVKRGEVFGIIGRNGAGKSTLLKILSRITGPTTGRIEIDGHVNSLLEVGTGFNPELTGRENVYMNGTLHGMSRREIDRKLDAIVEFAGVGPFLDVPIKRYSSGMGVRLGFAVAAFLEPQILIVDEVLAVGDAEFQRRSLGKMEAVSREEGRTVLFVSHNMGTVSALCHRTMVLDGGRIDFIGDTQEAIRRYLTRNQTEAGAAEYPPAPGKEIQVSAVRVLDTAGKATRHLSILDPFTVEIAYEVRAPRSGVAVSAALLTPLDECLVSTCDIDLDRSRLAARGPGRHVTRVRFPGRLLNSGVLNLAVGISVPASSTILDRQEVMQLEFFDSGSFVVTGGGEARRNATLLLELPWE